MENLSFYTKQEVAAILKVSVRAVEKYVKAGRLKVLKLDASKQGAARIARADFEAFIASMKCEHREEVADANS